MSSNNVMANTYVIEHVAYLKMILHATKHAGEVNGVLLGQKNGNEIVVSESIPLLHHWQALSPMMEIGLDLVRHLDSAMICLLALLLGILKCGL